jgi:hypothetical protein
VVGGVSQHYYNTTTLSGRELRQYETAAAGQESDVLALFQTYPDRDFSPDDVHQRVLQDAPITSVRRAMTNLTTRGLLVKTERKTLGIEIADRKPPLAIELPPEQIAGYCEPEVFPRTDYSSCETIRLVGDAGSITGHRCR